MCLMHWIERRLFLLKKMTDERKVDFEIWADCFVRAMNLRIGYLKSIGEWDQRGVAFEDLPRSGKPVWDVTQALYKARRNK